MMDTTVIDVPNSRAIAKQLLTLAQDPDNQPFIVQEAGCMAGLVSYMDHEDMDVVLMSARTLQFLASHPNNKKVMKDFPSLVSNLVRVYTRPRIHAKAKEFAGQALDSLGVSYHNESEQDENNPAQQPPAAAATPVKRAPAKLNPFQTMSVGVGPDVSDTLAERVKGTLIRVHGVISVTLDQDLGIVTIGTREDKAKLFDAVKSALADAEVTVHRNDGASGEGDDYDMPEYANESDYDDDDVGDNAVSRWGASSLEARLEKQREEEERRKAEKSERLIGKVGNALSSASSWLMGW